MKVAKLMIVWLAVGPLTARAAITYVDAIANTNGSDGNTTIAGALVDTTPTTGNATTTTENGLGPNDGKWNLRARAATNGGGVFESRNAETTPELITTVTLPPGTYDLYGLFWTNGTSSTYDAAFHVGPTTPFTAFNRTNANFASADGTEFAGTVSTREGTTFYLNIAPLGRHVVTDTLEIYVFAPAGNERTWYDGIGYELVTSLETLPVSDSFGDGDRDNDGVLDDPDGSGTGTVDSAADAGLKWRRVFRTGVENQTVRVTPDVAGPTSLGTDNTLLVNTAADGRAYQVASFPLTVLDEAADYIRLTFKVRFESFINDADAFRFGLFYDSLTPATADLPTGDTVADDTGYSATTRTGSAPNQSGIYNAAPGGSSSYMLFGADQSITIVSQAPFTIDDQNPRTISVTIVRLSSNAAYIEYAIDGEVVLTGQDTVFPVFCFNEVAFGSMPSPSSPISYRLDDVQIETGVVPACQGIAKVSVGTPIAVGAMAVNVSGILPEAETVNVYANGDTLVGSTAGSPPNTPSSLSVTVSALALGDQVTARQVIGGVESCVTATPRIVGNCADVAAVGVETVFVGDNTVTVVGVDPAATAVSVYANGTTLLGTAPADGNGSVVVVVPFVNRSDTISATQTVGGVESCATAGVPAFSAPLTYVDGLPNTTGTDGNTTINGALVDFTSGAYNATTDTNGSTTDNRWYYRPYAATNGGFVWELNGAEDAADLAITIAPPPGVYEVYALFWNHKYNTGVWDAAARVGTTGDFTFFDRTSAFATRVDHSDTVQPLSNREGELYLLAAPLGRVLVTEPLTVYIRAIDVTTADDRTWFDGLGYAPACSDPFADADGDGDVDMTDFAVYQTCFTGAFGAGPMPAQCTCFDRGVLDGSVSGGDLLAFINCFSGPSVPADPDCDNSN